MAFLHTHSCECMKSELDLFTLPPTQTSIENSSWIHYKPISSLTGDSPIEFSISGTSDDYIDLAHTMLSLKVKMTKKKNDVAIGESAGPVNNLLHSLFNQVDVYFNQKLVSPPNNAYPYRAYIETLLNYGHSAKSSHLTSVLWYDDSAGKMEGGIAENIGLKNRRKFLQDEKTLDLIGHLHCDVFNQEKFLVNGVEVGLRLVRSRDSFCLIDVGDTATIQITEASLIVRRVKISPTVLLAHAKALSQTTAKYPLTRVEVKAFAIHSGVHGESLDNAVLGQLPKRIILGFVDNKAYNGESKCNPFNFKNYKINYLTLCVDGVQVPSKALQPKFNDANDGQFISGYQTLFSGTGIHFMNEGNCISRDMYPEGYCLFAFDLTPDLSANSDSHWNLVRHGSVRIEVRFDAALTETINCIMYAEYDNVLEIDAARQIIVDYSG